MFKLVCSWCKTIVQTCLFNTFLLPFFKNVIIWKMEHKKS